jgi:hypothetical protein
MADGTWCECMDDGPYTCAHHLLLELRARRAARQEADRLAASLIAEAEWICDSA